MMRFVSRWALAGAIIPLVILIFDRIVDKIRGSAFQWLWMVLGIIFWPSWLLLEMLEYEEWFTPYGILVTAISIAVNVILYAAVGSIVWFILRQLLKR